MPRPTASTAKPLSIEERKARVAHLVKKGVLTPQQAKLIEFREPSDALRAEARKLIPAAKRALARASKSRQAA